MPRRNMLLRLAKILVGTGIVAAIFGPLFTADEDEREDKEEDD